MLVFGLQGAALASELTKTTTHTSTGAEYTTVPFNLSVFAPLDLNPGVGRVRNHFTLSLAFSQTDQLHGVELGAGVSLVYEEVRGAQISAVLNYAAATTGAQIATVNLSSQLTGGQLGVVNWTGRGRGFQLGVVNVSSELDGEALGVFSWSTKSGILAGEVWSADTGLVNAGVKFGTRHIYNLFFVSAAPMADASAWAPGYGLGVHLPLMGRLFVDVDLTMMAPNLHERLRDGDAPDTLYSVRLAPAIRLTETLSVFAGPSLNILHDPGPTTAESLVPSHAWRLSADEGSDAARVDMWIGFQLGLRAGA